MYEKESKNDKPVPIGTIEDYPSASFNDDPLLYPGKRPETSFLLDSIEVYTVVAENRHGVLDFRLQSSDGTESSLDDYLRSRQVQTMGERVPVLAYGANMCPASIYSKFDKVGREDAHIVPTLYADLSGYDVVWSGGPGWNGNFIANLYRGVETEDTTVTIGVNFLTQEQLLVMHATEMSYDLTTVAVNIDGVDVRAVLYAGVDDIFVENGKPVAVDAIKPKNGSRTLRAANTRELVDEMIGTPAMRDFFVQNNVGTIQNADDYIDSIQAIKGVKGARKARKLEVLAKMAELGKAKAYRLPIDATALQSWSNPSTIPTYNEQLAGGYHRDVYSLPTSVLDKDRWRDPVKRRSVLANLSKHYVNLSGLKETPKHS